MATTRHFTADELMEITEPGRYDLIRGELIAMAPTSEEHGSISSNFVGHLWNHVRQHGLGRLYTAEAGFVLARDPDVVLVPDVAFVRKDRLPPEHLRTKFYEGAPDLAIEVISPSERTTQTNQKVLEYLQAGTRLVWVVDPPRRTITVYHPDRSAQILRADDELSGNDVFPEFRIQVAEFFE
jgi:Uma2 family endonuclease